MRCPRCGEAYLSENVELSPMYYSVSFYCDACDTIIEVSLHQGQLNTAWALKDQGGLHWKAAKAGGA